MYPDYKPIGQFGCECGCGGGDCESQNFITVYEFDDDKAVMVKPRYMLYITHGRNPDNVLGVIYLSKFNAGKLGKLME